VDKIPPPLRGVRDDSLSLQAASRDIPIHDCPLPVPRSPFTAPCSLLPHPVIFPVSPSRSPPMSNEPEYLRRIREAKAQKAKSGASGAKGEQGNLSVQEQEAVKWARELGGANL